MTIMRRAPSEVVLFLAMASVVRPAGGQQAPVPDKLVVLTFDDSAKSHATYVAPLLKQLGFGGQSSSPRASTFPRTRPAT